MENKPAEVIDPGPPPEAVIARGYRGLIAPKPKKTSKKKK